MWSTSGTSWLPLADLAQKKKRSDVAYQRWAARADAAVARARGADGGEQRWGKQAREDMTN